MTRPSIAAGVALLALVIGGCSWTSFSMDEASSAAASTDTVVIVGKVTLTPKFDPEYEQKTHWNAPDADIVNRIFLLTGNTADAVDTENLALADFKNNIPASWGDIFFLESPRRRHCLRAGMIVLDATQPNERVWFPGGYCYEVPARASAIYIGTLHYTRDDFYMVKNMEVRDEYQEALTAFRKKFGTSATLDKSLLKKAR